ncbi:hypothetical protein DMH26_12615 [Streptomyces sp. WAC 05379]|uniref:radical SAM protein n=1 Tax=Streptomyces sp. WAC 05379 TaxID=2203207 RepID=UPI000F74B5FC|nr:radical SAM protein [Streptomyces sp. WAC 05379]RSO03093.1 hypothetical protein DMH26_12615 [Streptomyces sp. WAC 05379]
MRRLTLAEVEDARWGHGNSGLLFITDRCPVGCAHCSVDSRPDSPRITDFALFEDIVSGLALSQLSMVGISGGEPFVERRALQHAVRTLRAADKDVVVYTSGIWANTASPPNWVQQVIQQCGAIFLSTDSFHQAEISDERFMNAARAIATHGVPIFVQVVEVDGLADRTESLLTAALGPTWSTMAEIKMVEPLPYGRAEGMFTPAPRRRGSSFGTCPVAKAPVVRYDGVVTGCCNESVLLGGGPAWLRRKIGSALELAETLEDFRKSPLLQIIARVGVGELAHHPRAGDVGDREFHSICGACWLAVKRLADDPQDGLLTAMAAMGEESAL